MESQVELKQEISTKWKRFRELLPDVGEAYEEMPRAVYAGGSLDAKTKRLMALAIAVTHGCRACILYQTGQALELGADVEEILEACAVAVTIGGTMAAGETARVVSYLEELGKI